MKFSLSLVLATAIATFAQDTPTLIAARTIDEASAWGQEAQLDARQAGGPVIQIPATVQVGDGPEKPMKLTLSERCAAEARGGVSKRSMEEEQAHMTHCGTPGYVENAGPRVNIHDITYDECANDCVCSVDYDSCMAFAWRENKQAKGRGHCLMYTKTLHEMGFMPGVDPKGKGHRNHLFYSRSCYRKTLPKPHHIHTKGHMHAKAPQATAAPVVARDSGNLSGRSTDIDADLILAMERI